jgi:hypothetical protein
MSFDGGDAQVQCVGDLAIGLSSGNKLQNLAMAVRELSSGRGRCDKAPTSSAAWIA